MIDRASASKLLALLPQYFQMIKEYPEIMKAWAEGLDLAGNSIEAVWNNLYIMTCDEATLEVWEARLNLTPLPGDSLEIRRERVYYRLSSSVPYSERKIRTLLDQMYGPGGYDLIVDSVNQTVNMTIKTLVPDGILNFCIMWYSYSPAHVEMSVTEDIESDIDGNMYFGGSVNSTIYINI